MRHIPLLIFTVVVDYIGMAVSYTTFPFLFFDSTHHTLVSQFSPHERAVLLGVLFSLMPLGRLIGGPLFGKLSDQYGRRKLLLLSTIVTMLSTFLTALSISFYSLSLLLASRFIAGLFSGNIVVSQASLVDISEQQNKAWRLNLLEIGMAAGLMLGPLLGARLMSSQEVYWFSYSTPFYFVLIANVILVVLLLIFFTETLPEAVMKTQQLHRAIGQSPNAEHLSFFLGIKQLFQALNIPRLRILFLVWALSMGGYTLYIEFFSGFLKEQLHFSAIQLSNLSLIVAIFYIVYQVCLVYPLTHRVSAQKLIRPTLLMLGVLIFCMGLSRSSGLLYVFRLAYEAAMVVFIPNFNAVLSNIAGKKDQGQAFGIMSSVYSFASLVVALVGGPLAAYDIAAPIMVGGSLIVIAALILVAKFTVRG